MKGKCLFTLAWVALVSIALSVMVDAEGKHQERMNINEGKVQRAEETKRSKTEHSLFPRVCGYHSWVVCGRRRRSSSGKVNFNATLVWSGKTITRIKLFIKTETAIWHRLLWLSGWVFYLSYFSWRNFMSTVKMFCFLFFSALFSRKLLVSTFVSNILIFVSDWEL